MHLCNWSSLNRRADLVNKVAVTLRTVIMVDEERLEVEVANRDTVKTQVIHLERFVGAESTVEDCMIVRITVSKVVLGHVRVDILFSLSPRLAVVATKGLIAHDVEAVILAFSKSHPLAASSSTAVLLAVDPLVSYKAEIGSLHDVICDLGLDILGDGLDCVIHGKAVVVEEEPSCAEELGNW